MADITMAPEIDAPTDKSFRTGRDDLRDFVGPNAETYLTGYDKKQKRKSPGYMFGPALVPLCWLMYRKMYVASGCLLMGGLVISLVLPHISAGAGIAGVFGSMGKTFYLAHAEKKVRKIAARNLPLDEHVALLRRAGGVSWLGATVGTIISLAGVAAIFLSHQPH